MDCEFIRKKHLQTYQKMSYVGEVEDVIAITATIDCSYGTNPFGYSRRVSDLNGACLSEINNYPQYPYFKMRHRIAEYWREAGLLDVDCIRLGNGSMGVLNTINRILISEGTRVLGYTPQFTDYITEVRSQGGVYESVGLRKERNYKFDCDEFINRMNGEQYVIYIDNPNNPTGQIIPLDEIRRIVEAAEHLQMCVIVDEAYGDFMSKQNSAIALTNKYENLFVTRSFSKGFGLAGLRIGYAVCSPCLAPFYKKMDTAFSVPESSCRIAAQALGDETFIKDSIQKVTVAKKTLIDVCKKIRIWETSLETPILVMQHPYDDVNLFQLFAQNGVLTEAGTDFVGLGGTSVRLRIPADIDSLIRIVKSIEDQI